MQQELKNKVAVITGGARGIGFAIAEDILRSGAKHVVLLDINANNGTEAANTLNSKYGEEKALFLKTDVTKDVEEISKVVLDKYKTVDILVNSAGTADERDVRRMFELNTIAVIEWSRKFLEHMRKDKGGSGGTILNISSIYGYAVDPLFSVYKASKYGVMGFSKTIGHIKNYEVTGVRVVVLCPGRTLTELLDEAWPENLVNIDIENFVVGDQTAEDVSRAAIEVITTVPSGTAWGISCAKPIEEV